MRQERVLWETEFWFDWGDTRHIVHIRIMTRDTPAEIANAVGAGLFAVFSAIVLAVFVL